VTDDLRMLCVSDERVHIADPRIPLLLFTLDGIAPPLEELARRAGSRGALARSEGTFALSQAHAIAVVEVCQCVG
jgi:hypothetical protein